MGEAMSATVVKSAGLGSGLVERRAAKYALPQIARPAGLYDPEAGKSSCGVGFIVNLKREKSHRIVEDGLRILENLEHRGAVGADPLMGDGAGIMVADPAPLLRRRGRTARLRPARSPAHYAVSRIFLPQDAATPRRRWRRSSRR